MLDALWREVVALATGAAAAAGVLGYVASKVLEHWLARLAQEHENRLKTQADALLTAFKRELDTDAAMRIEAYKTQLSEDSATRIEAYRNQLGEDSSARAEALRIHLATESGRQLELLKSELQKGLQVQIELAKQRQPAYQRLWEMTEVVSPSRETPLTEELRHQFDADLTSYYYRDGNALFLSLEATDRLLKAKKLLRGGPEVSDKVIRDAFSDLRTRMKSDLAVYAPGEESRQIGI